MRTKTLLTVSIALVVLLIASPLGAGTWDGTIKLGGIITDEEGDLSAVQETYNIHDGFAISQFRIAGKPGPRDYLMLDLKEINLDGRQGKFLFRRPGFLQESTSRSRPASRSPSPVPRGAGRAPFSTSWGRSISPPPAA